MSENAHVLNGGRILRPLGFFKRSCNKQVEDAKAVWCLKTFMLEKEGRC